jgi:hypothetical protein
LIYEDKLINEGIKLANVDLGKRMNLSVMNQKPISEFKLS